MLHVESQTAESSAFIFQTCRLKKSKLIILGVFLYSDWLPLHHALYKCNSFIIQYKIKHLGAKKVIVSIQITISF